MRCPPLEKLAHYSRALRAGDIVLQSGITAIEGRSREPSARRGAGVVRQQPSGLAGLLDHGLARPELLVEVEVAAVKGASAGIEWIEPDETNPLD